MQEMGMALPLPKAKREVELAWEKWAEFWRYERNLMGWRSDACICEFAEKYAQHETARAEQYRKLAEDVINVKPVPPFTPTESSSGEGPTYPLSRSQE